MWGFFINFNIMATEEKKTTEKKPVKKYKVLKKNVGTGLTWIGELITLNNGLDQKLLKELFNAGIKAIVNE